MTPRKREQTPVELFRNIVETQQRRFNHVLDIFSPWIPDEDQSLLKRGIKDVKTDITEFPQIVQMVFSPNYTIQPASLTPTYYVIPPTIRSILPDFQDEPGMYFNTNWYAQMIKELEGNPMSPRYWFHEDFAQTLAKYSARASGPYNKVSMNTGLSKVYPKARLQNIPDDYIYAIGWRYVQVNPQEPLNPKAISLTPQKPEIEDIVRTHFIATILNMFFYGVQLVERSSNTRINIHQIDDNERRSLLRLGYTGLQSNINSIPELNLDNKIGLIMFDSVNGQDIREKIQRSFYLASLPLHEFLQQATEQEIKAFKKAKNLATIGTNLDEPPDGVITVMVI